MSRYLLCSENRPPVDARGQSERLWLYSEIPECGKPVAGRYTSFGDDYVGIEGADDDGEYVTETGEIVSPTHFAVALPDETEPPAVNLMGEDAVSVYCNDGQPHQWEPISTPESEDMGLVVHAQVCAKCGAIWD